MLQKDMIKILVHNWRYLVSNRTYYNSLIDKTTNLVDSETRAAKRGGRTTTVLKDVIIITVLSYLQDFRSGEDLETDLLPHYDEAKWLLLDCDRPKVIS